MAKLGMNHEDLEFLLNTMRSIFFFNPNREFFSRFVSPKEVCSKF